jgi:acetylornithine deacetylase/succinyl-diaminopimelate desuccinylase-like protein
MVESGSLEAYLDDTAQRRLERFLEFLRIPSISGIPAHADDCRRAAESIAAELREAGMEHVEVAETGGHPVVYADWLHAAGAPTILGYAHYDVQPVDPIEQWTRAPFEPAVSDGRVLGRGAADDKSHVHMLIRAAEAALAVRGALPVNLKLMIEGEEEATSISLEPWMRANRERLAADIAVVSDTGFFDGNIPAITVSLRGMCYVQVDVTGPSVDLHSGMYGGTVDDPANALCAIVAALKGPDGRILVPGFYDDVRPLSALDRSSLAELPFDEERFLEETGSPALVGEVGFTTLERRSSRPTLDVNGIWGGFTGDGPKTIIPAEAHAKISARLVPDQDPERIYEAIRSFILDIAPPGVRVEVKQLGLGSPGATAIDHPVTQAAARAIEATFGRPPVYIREGGSVPVTAVFEPILGIQPFLVGFMNPDCRAHAPDESLVYDNFERGIRALVRFWDEVAALPR